MAQTKEITNFTDQMVYIGEVYKFTYQYEGNYPFIDMASEVEKVITAGNAGHFLILGTYEDKTTSTVTCWTKIINNPLPFLVAFAVFVGLVGILTWLTTLSLSKVEQVLDNSIVPAAIGGFSIILVGIGLFVSYMLFWRH